MKLLNFLSDIFDEHECAVLRFFYNYQEDAFTGRFIAQQLNMNHKTCLSVLEKYCDLGILRKEIVGRAYLFSVIKSYYWQTIIFPVFKKEEDLLDLIKLEIIALFSKECKKIIVFGSYATNHVSLSSDIDICFVTDRDEDKLNRQVNMYVDKFYVNYLCHLSPYIISTVDFNSANTSLVNDIKKTGVLIYDQNEGHTCK